MFFCVALIASKALMSRNIFSLVWACMPNLALLVKDSCPVKNEFHTFLILWCFLRCCKLVLRCVFACLICMSVMFLLIHLFVAILYIYIFTHITYITIKYTNEFDLFCGYFHLLQMCSYLPPTVCGTTFQAVTNSIMFMHVLTKTFSCDIPP